MVAVILNLTTKMMILWRIVLLYLDVFSIPYYLVKITTSGRIYLRLSKEFLITRASSVTALHEHAKTKERLRTL